MATIKATYFLTSCKGKLRYKSPKEAQEVVQRMNRENRNAGLVGRMEYYPCEFCGDYHVGHELNRERKIKDESRKGRGR